LAKAHQKEKTLRIALVGGETLLGREVREVLESRGTGAAITAYASSGEGNFSEQDGEAVYVEPLEVESVKNNEAILIAGSAEGSLKAYEVSKKAGGKPVLIDCTGHLENRPDARIVAPLMEEPDVHASPVLVIAHPAASALALSLTKLARYRPIQRSVAHIFEPASERGKRGVSELHHQTTSLLSFKPLEKKVFDAQLSFNLLSQYGEDAPDQLSAVEQRVERHVATILSRRHAGVEAPMPSLRIIQAPVFHGYSLSIWVEFAEDITLSDLGEALASAQIEVRGENETVPDSVGAASQSGLIAGDIRIDRNNARAAWFWVVADNLRLTADAAADLINSLRTEQQ
jgi:aspartate-semialdehyde dehydrogenase